MCRLGKKLKLCSCLEGTLLKGKVLLREHVWVLFRFIPGKENYTMGRVRVPDRLDPTLEAAHRALLLERLQEPDVFDVELGLRPRDRLLLVFRTQAPKADPRETLSLQYGYEFDGTHWTECEYDDLSWAWCHDRKLAGKVRDALVL